MKTITLSSEIGMTSQSCCLCGVQFMMLQSLREKRIDDGEPFYCTNGHGQCFRESEAERLRKLLKAEESRYIETKIKLNQTEEALKKLESRAANGVCPCCKRSFAQLHRHMRTKHPDFVAVAK